MDPPRAGGGAPSPEDEYADYAGPPLPYEWGEVEDLDGVDMEILVELEREPSPEEREALERAIRAWDFHGRTEGFGEQILGGTGYLKGLYEEDERFAARWKGNRLLWFENFGTANGEVAGDDLARRLAGWSARWNLPITFLQIGV